MLMRGAADPCIGLERNQYCIVFEVQALHVVGTSAAGLPPTYPSPCWISFLFRGNTAPFLRVLERKVCDRAKPQKRKVYWNSSR